MPRNWRAAPGLLAPPVIVALLAAGCGPAAEGKESASPVSAPASEQLVLLDFDEGATAVGAILPSVSNGGVADLRADFVTTNGGRVHRVEGRDGGYAAQFPTFRDGEPSGALVVLRPTGEDDPLSPGEDDFSFGADVRLDETSFDDSDTSTDDGDNVLQRGFALDPVQLKLQVDRGIASCRVQGAEGDALVKADVTFEPGHWYRVRCDRNGEDLTILWESLDDPEAPDAFGTATVTTPTGAVDFPAEVPMSVGGKAAPDGSAVESSSDQFNGTLDNVWYDVLGGS